MVLGVNKVCFRYLRRNRELELLFTLFKFKNNAH
jgi:hypothetical protein